MLRSSRLLSRSSSSTSPRARCAASSAPAAMWHTGNSQHFGYCQPAPPPPTGKQITALTFTGPMLSRVITSCGRVSSIVSTRSEIPHHALIGANTRMMPGPFAAGSRRPSRKITPRSLPSQNLDPTESDYHNDENDKQQGTPAIQQASFFSASTFSVSPSIPVTRTCSCAPIGRAANGCPYTSRAPAPVPPGSVRPPPSLPCQSSLQGL